MLEMKVSVNFISSKSKKNWRIIYERWVLNVWLKMLIVSVV